MRTYRRRPRRRRTATALMMLLLGLSTYGVALGLAVALPAAPAQAHTDLTGSDPEAGSTLDALPAQVVLTFTEEIGEPAYVAVRTADGTTYEDGGAAVEANTVTQQLVDSDVSGEVTIAYRVVSADGHPVTGEFGVEVTGDGAADSPDDEGNAAGNTDGNTAGDTHADHGEPHEDGSIGDAVDGGPGLAEIAGATVLVAVVVAATVAVFRRRRP